MQQSSSYKNSKLTQQMQESNWIFCPKFTCAGVKFICTSGLFSKDINLRGKHVSRLTKLDYILCGVNEYGVDKAAWAESVCKVIGSSSYNAYAEAPTWLQMLGSGVFTMVWTAIVAFLIAFY